MKARPLDTHPDIEKIQIELLRRASPARRFGIARSLTRTVMSLSRRAIGRTLPNATREEIDIAFVRHTYGPELADRLRDYLARRRS